MTSVLDITSEQTVSRTAENSGACLICGSGEFTDLLVAPDRFHLRTELYRLVRCTSCEGVRLVDPPTPEEMGRHYTSEYHAAIVAAGEGSASKRWKPQVDLISRFKQGGSILDIGCSSGGFLSTMKGPSWDLYGIEMEESTAEQARANTAAKVFVGDAVMAPFAAGSFDVVTSFDVLEHVYDPREFLTRVHAWLKPGGIYCAMMPNIDSWEARLFGTYWYGLELPRHLSHFSPTSLRRLMATLGFEEVVVRTPRVSYVERSLDYVVSDLAERLGFSPTPQSKPKPLSILMKVLRKIFRLAVIAPLAQMASWAGAGPSLEVVFRKAKA